MLGSITINYMGRTDADLTGWIEYFVATLASVFAVAKQEALRYAAAPLLTEPEELRQLDYRARTVLAHFSRQEQIASAEVATALGLSERMARLLLSTWVQQGWMVISNPSRRSRKYALRADIRSYLDGLNR